MENVHRLRSGGGGAAGPRRYSIRTLAPRSNAFVGMKPNLRQARANLIKERAVQLRFDSCGVTDLEPVPHREELEDWLDRGYAGTMRYMHRQVQKRLHPAQIVPGATRAVVLTRNYETDGRDIRADEGEVARYARGHDYHKALASPLEEMTEFVRHLGGSKDRTRYFVDAGPVPERELAQHAGLGWIGKNTMLISPWSGSFFFIATILTDLEIQVDEAFATDRCGTCRRCLDVCPTQAFPSARVLDATKCISYLTIEYRGDISNELADRMGTWIFGCDECQTVCPWNEKFGRPMTSDDLGLGPSMAGLDLGEIHHMDNEGFQRSYGETAMERTGLAGLQRNAVIVQRNRESQERAGDGVQSPVG